MEKIEKTILIENNKPDELTIKRRKKIFSGLAAACLISGFAAPFLGLLLFILHSILANSDVLSSIGTFLMIVSIPLLLTGSHFLDLIEKAGSQQNKS